MNETLYGMRVFASDLAVSTTVKWLVKKHPTRKRRKAWGVHRVEVKTPCVFQTPMGFFMHPTLIAQLKREKHEHTFRP